MRFPGKSSQEVPTRQRSMATFVVAGPRSCVPSARCVEAFATEAQRLRCPTPVSKATLPREANQPASALSLTADTSQKQPRSAHTTLVLDASGAHGIQRLHESGTFRNRFQVQLPRKSTTRHAKQQILRYGLRRVENLSVTHPHSLFFSHKNHRSPCLEAACEQQGHGVETMLAWQDLL